MEIQHSNIPLWALERIQDCRNLGGMELDLSRIEYDEDEIPINRLDHLTPIETLPEEIKELKNLKVLKIGNNPIKKLPSWIWDFEQLSHLDLTLLNISDLPKALLSVSKLKRLVLVANQLTNLPYWFQNLGNLISLDLSYNSLSNLPDGFQNLTNLTTLYLNLNELVNLPNELQNLTNLNTLGLSYNGISNLPDWFQNLSNLTTLDLSSNYLTDLPDWFQNLDNLTRLDLSNNNLLELPDWFQNLINLSTLNLSEIRLTDLPDGFRKLINLTTLYLSGNNLSELPYWFQNLTNLNTLDLSANNLVELPDWFQNLTNLNTLDLSTNNLAELPDWFQNLTNLSTLDLSETSLTDLPDRLQNLTNLTALFFSSNHLVELPDWFQNLINLSTLDLSFNDLSELPGWFQDLTNLTTLDLSANTILVLPDWFQNLTNLTSLDLSHNNILELPDWFQNLTNLNKLNLRRIGLSKLPAGFQNLSKLSSLNLSSNNISELPVWFQNLNDLFTLDLSDNNLSELPEGFQNLTKLISLELGGNSLSNLPEGFYHLSNLINLNILDNNLTELPDLIQNLTNLESLNLLSNQLISLPKGLLNLNNLMELDLRNNPDLGIPDEILDNTRDPASILAYYFETQLDTHPLNEAKIILVGEGAVGKTSIVNRLVLNIFDPTVSRTQGIQVTDWGLQINGDHIDLHIWDFGGQEIMHATHQFFLTRRSLYLLVLNVREDEIKNRIEYWLKTIEAFGEDSPIIIVGNHDDEMQGLDIDKVSLKEKYPQIEVILTTSCAENLGIANLRESIINTVKKMNYVRDPLPPTWFIVKELLEIKKKKKEEGGDGLTVMSYPEFIMVCEKEGITNRDSQRGLIVLLHNLGIVLNFRDPRSPLSLQQTQVLNPEWVTNGVYKLINNPELIRKGGIFQLEDVRQILTPPDYPEDIHRHFILDIMEKFELCYSWGKPVNYLVPDLLDKERKVTNLNFSQALRFEYHYDVLPPNLFAHFMVRRSNEVQPPFYWRTGVLLGKSETRALVTVDRADKIIRLAVIGNPVDRKDFLASLRYEIETINERYTINVKQMIPVPDFPEVLADYKHIKVLAEKGHDTFIPVGMEEEVNVKELLGEYRTKTEALTGEIIEALEGQKKQRPALSSPTIIKDEDLHKKIDSIKQKLDQKEQEITTPLKGWVLVMLVFIIIILSIFAIIYYIPLNNFQTYTAIILSIIATVVLLAVLGRLSKEAAEILGKLPGPLGEYLTGGKSNTK